MITYLALGDSYTIGEGVPATENFPNYTAQLLRDTGIGVADPTIIARTGWTTDELLAAIMEHNLSGPYDIVTLLIGVNNQYRGRGLDNYTDEFHNLLHLAIKFAGGRVDHVVVLSIPDWGVTPFAHDRDKISITQEIDAFNEVNRFLALDHDCHYLEITESTRLNASNPGYLADDGLHPSGKEYALWGNQLSEVINHKILGSVQL